MRNALAIVALGVCALGCTEGVTQPDLEAVYTLESIDGEALPAIVDVTTSELYCEIRVADGVLEFEAQRRLYFVSIGVYSVCNGVHGSASVEHQSGIYVQNDRNLGFTADTPGNLRLIDGSISGDHVSLTVIRVDDARVWRFTRSSGQTP